MESNSSTTVVPKTGEQGRTGLPRFGIQSGLIYWGIVVLMATLLLWLGVELAKRIEWFLPYAGGLGLSLIAAGFFLEIRRAGKEKRGREVIGKQGPVIRDQ